MYNLETVVMQVYIVRLSQSDSPIILAKIYHTP